MANYTSVTASNICDAAGNKLASGTVSFQATDAANQPLNFQVGGGGQVVTTPATAAITAGAIAGGFQVADSANTSPAGILYRITITDTTLNRVVVTYSLVTVTGTTFSLDNFSQTGAAVLPPVGGSVNGPLTVAGSLSVTGGFVGGAINSSEPGVFTNVRMQSTHSVIVGTSTPTIEFGPTAGGNFCTDAIVACITEPVTGTTYQVNAVSGYVRTSALTNGTNNAGGSVALFGQAHAVGTGNSKIWGFNTVTWADNGTSPTMHGGEIDIAVGNTTPTGLTGLQFAGSAGAALPANSTVIAMGPLDPAFPWTTGILIGAGTATTALAIGPQQTTGNFINSMPILFVANNGSGVGVNTTLESDFLGDLIVQSGGSTGGRFLAPHFGSTTPSISSVGVLQLAAADTIGWRNNGGTGDIVLGKDASDRLTYNSQIVSDGSHANGLTIASGIAVLGTSAVSAGTSATAVTVAAIGVTTTDSIEWSFNAAPGTGYTAGLEVKAYVTSGNVNFLVTNPTAGSLTPAAATLNWRVVR